MAAESGREFAIKFQQTFELYLIGLVFTVLGLAVQTAPPQPFLVISVLEIAGWFCLGVSGVLGLLRLERVPMAHIANAKVHEVREFIANAQRREAQGELTVLDERSAAPMPVADAIATLRNREKKLLDERGRLERLIPRMYSIHKWTFVLGLILIVVSRAAWRLAANAEVLSM